MPLNPKITLSTDEAAKQFKGKMTEMALKNKERDVAALAQSLGVPYVDLEHFLPSLEALSFMPEEDAKRLNLVPLLNENGEVRLATTDTTNPALPPYIEALKAKHSGRYSLYLISPHNLERALALYMRVAKLRPMNVGVSIQESDIAKYQGQSWHFGRVGELLKSSSLTELVTVIVAGALEMRASDIHIEAESDGITIRYRIDGTLHVVAQVPKNLWPQVVSRLKLLSKLKLNITAEPQDGRFTIFLSNDEVDVRVSTIPTAYGESVVMRLLRSSTTGLAFEDLGLRGKAYEDMKREVERPNGMILATGPTGSGKTTTLYAILNKLNGPDKKIITLEDPIEYKLKGINQSQIDHSKGYDFAKGLKAILRQDPQIVMVGEIRDFETADIAINASLTGHLVISTIHTNSAAGAIPRFISMGIKPFLLSPALNCIIGQRLVRRLCQDCKQKAQVPDETVKRVQDLLRTVPEKVRAGVNLDQLTFYSSPGCDACGHLGYRGRIGIYEVMTMNAEIEKLVFDNKGSEAELHELAIRNGMVTMVQDGLLKVLDGITSLEEVFKVAE
jgi:type IV pilus assembly protein PilB